jgi:hypothetical protein
MNQSVKSVKSVVAFLLFVLIGVVTAAVGELQYSVFIRGDWANLFGSMVFNAAYLAGAFALTRLLLRLWPRRPAFVITVALAAVAGLSVEWFLIGNSPWGNPDASQMGMAAYWAAMVVVPLIVLDPDARLRPLKRAIAVYAVVYSLLALAAAALLPRETWGYVYQLRSVIFGYLGLTALMIVGYLRAKRTVVRSIS